MPFDGFDYSNLTETQKNCLYVADVIEAGIYGFDMDSWFREDPRHSCGTAGCIAGTAFIIKTGAHDEDKLRAAAIDLHRREIDFVRSVGEYLGLDVSQEVEMFTPSGMILDHIDRHMAAGALRRFVFTGKIHFDPEDRGKIGAGYEHATVA